MTFVQFCIVKKDTQVYSRYIFMTTKQSHISDLHHEHKVWQNELSFQKQQIKLFKNWLGEVSKNNTAADVKVKVEHFQNQFIIHNEVLDTLLHEITIHEQNLTQYAEKHPVAIEHVLFESHTDFRDKVETQGSMYAALRQEFKRFTADHL